MIEVYAPGTVVTLTCQDEIPARILTVELALGSVTYEVAWWSSGTRHVAQMTELEFDAGEEQTKIQIGFKNAKD